MKCEATANGTTSMCVASGVKYYIEGGIGAVKATLCNWHKQEIENYKPHWKFNEA